MNEGGYQGISAALDRSVLGDYLKAQQSLLPELPDVTQLTPCVIRILAQNPGKFTLQGTNTYIVGTGKRRILIDTGQGVPEWAEILQNVLESRCIELSLVLLSHRHGDHTKGIPNLLQKFPHLSDSIYKHTPEIGQRPICDKQIFHVDGATVRAVHGEGHCSDHMCFVLEEENAMFTGDTLLGHGTSVVENLGLFMQTLQQLDAIGCRKGYPAHGCIISDLAKNIRGEISTKIRRERNCLNALEKIKQEKGSVGRAASITTKDLVTVVYGSPMSREVCENILVPFMDEVLRKLVTEGKVAFLGSNTGRRWFAL